MGGGPSGSSPSPPGRSCLTCVSLSQAGQVELVTRLLAGVLLEGPEGLSGGLDALPGRQRLLLEARGNSSSRRGHLQRCMLGGLGGGAADAEESLSVCGSQQLQD